MKFLSYLGWAVLALVALVVTAGQLGLFSGKPPTMGLRDGKLKPPSKTPNSVSSQAALDPDHPQKDYAATLPLRFSGDPDAAMAKLLGVLKNWPRTVIVSSDASYIYAQCTTALMKYTDDVEFLMDKSAGVIHVRSSSRVGRKDFGVNRARIEAIRVEFAKT